MTDPACRLCGEPMDEAFNTDPDRGEHFACPRSGLFDFRPTDQLSFDARLAARRKYDEAVLTPCECGREGCVNWVHPTEGIIGGFGPAGCPL